MTHEHRILEGIDACRPGGDDLRDPDLVHVAEELARNPRARELYDRSQQVDAAIAAAMGDVAVPEGGASRVLARLAAAAQTGASASDQSAASAAPAAELPVPATRKVSRRWLVAATGGLIAATVAVVVFNLPTGPDVNKDNLDDFVREFFKADQAPVDGLAQGQPPADYSLSTLISVRGNVRWRRITGLLGGRGVAYDLSPPVAGGQSRAVLYVLSMPSSLAGLGASPPRIPSTTGGVAIGAWQEKGRLYVLAVSGGEAEYRLFLRTESIA
jgi:hypothetical protein